MNLYTIGFTQKSARQFFEMLKFYKIELLADIRLNNKSQLAGFTKGSDLEYFLAQICGCKYLHCTAYAPTKEILDGYKKGTISWNEYEVLYNDLLVKRGNYLNFTKKFSSYNNVCLLCSEPTPEQCHRRLAAEMIAKTDKDVIIKHI